MKTFFTILFLCVGFGINAQTTSDSLYIVTYTTGTLWDANKAPNEQPYFKEHSANLSKLRKEGIIKLGARYADKGMIVIAANSFIVAKELILKDEAVSKGLFNADIQRFSVFYDGCVESAKRK